MIRITWTEQQRGRTHGAHIPTIPWLGCRITRLKPDDHHPMRHRIHVLVRGLEDDPRMRMEDLDRQRTRLVLETLEPETLEEAKAWFEGWVQLTFGMANDTELAEALDALEQYRGRARMAAEISRDRQRAREVLLAAVGRGGDAGAPCEELAQRCSSSLADAQALATKLEQERDDALRQLAAAKTVQPYQSAGAWFVADPVHGVPAAAAPSSTLAGATTIIVVASSSQLRCSLCSDEILPGEARTIPAGDSVHLVLCPACAANPPVFQSPLETVSRCAAATLDQCKQCCDRADGFVVCTPECCPEHETEAQAEPSPPPPPPLFYLQDARQVVGNSVLWWRKGSAGYTCDLNDAELFSEEQARAEHLNRDSDRYYSQAQIDALAERHIHLDTLHSQLGGGLHREEPAEQAECSGCLATGPADALCDDCRRCPSCCECER